MATTIVTKKKGKTKTKIYLYITVIGEKKSDKTGPWQQTIVTKKKLKPRQKNIFIYHNYRRAKVTQNVSLTTNHSNIEKRKTKAKFIKSILSGLFY